MSWRTDLLDPISIADYEITAPLLELLFNSDMKPDREKPTSCSRFDPTLSRHVGGAATSALEEGLALGEDSLGPSHPAMGPLPPEAPLPSRDNWGLHRREGAVRTGAGASPRPAGCLPGKAPWKGPGQGFCPFWGGGVVVRSSICEGGPNWPALSWAQGSRHPKGAAAHTCGLQLGQPARGDQCPHSAGEAGAGAWRALYKQRPACLRGHGAREVLMFFT